MWLTHWGHHVWRPATAQRQLQLGPNSRFPKWLHTQQSTRLARYARWLDNISRFFHVFSQLAYIESLEKDGKGFYHKSPKHRVIPVARNWPRIIESGPVTNRINSTFIETPRNVSMSWCNCTIGRTNVFVCKHPESYLSSNCAVSFALLVLSATPKHPFRQTTPPCSRAPAANGRWIVWMPRCKAIVASSLNPGAHQFRKYFKLRWCVCRATMPTNHNHWTWSNGLWQISQALLQKRFKVSPIQITSSTVLLGCHAGMWCRIP